MDINVILKWVTTVPGIFISLGVVLLFMAIIILIATSISKKREKVEEVEDTPAPVQNVESVGAPVQEGVMPTQVTDNLEHAQNVEPVNNFAPNTTVISDMNMSDQFVPTPNPTPVMPQNDVNQMAMPTNEVVQPVQTPVMPQPISDNTFVNPTPVDAMPTQVNNQVADQYSANVPTYTEQTVVTPAVTPVQVPQAPVEIPTVPVNPTYTVPTPIATNPAPVVEDLPMYQSQGTVSAMPQSMPEVSTVSQPTVYGGVSPVVNVPVVEEKPHQIYGGANPLDNTQPIPTVNNTTAYNMPEVTNTPVDNFQNFNQ